MYPTPEEQATAYVEWRAATLEQLRTVCVQTYPEWGNETYEEIWETPCALEIALAERYGYCTPEEAAQEIFTHHEDWYAEKDGHGNTI